MIIIVGISGKAGHGKDSLADYLKKYFDRKGHFSYSNLKFATKLKEVAKDLFDLSSWHVEAQAGKINKLQHFDGITPRDILQKLGTEVGRNLYKDIWVYHYAKQVEHLRESSRGRFHDAHIIFTTDVRFENEFNYVKYDADEFTNVMPYVIRVNRPGFNMDGDNNHKSETGLDDIPDSDWDFLINAYSLDELERRADGVVDEIYAKLEMSSVVK